MEHSLARQYGLTSNELLEAVSKRFRLKVALEGAVAEVQMEKRIKRLVGTSIERYEAYDIDGQPDFALWLPGTAEPILAECKNVRDSDEAYRRGGRIVGYKVETQKTRASRSDPLSRYYGIGQFHVLGVCLGKKTKDWSEFLFVRTVDLRPHAEYSGKLAVMQRVPLPDANEIAPWYRDLSVLLNHMADPTCNPSRSTKQS